jgi:hypothetical protein
VLVGVPAHQTVERDAIPPPAPVSAWDACDPRPALAFDEVRVAGGCTGAAAIARTWTATDGCGNAASARQVLELVDTTPPVVTPGDLDMACPWPPAPRMAWLGAEDIVPAIRDDCAPDVTWRFAACASDQPDEGTGEADRPGDCLIAGDGRSLGLRAERDGGEDLGRRYDVIIVAMDACGNESPPVRIGRVHVPHDAREAHPGCLDAKERPAP